MRSTTSVTVFEIRTGIEFLTPSRRRKRLGETFSQLLYEDLDGRVQSFDLTAALAAGAIAATQQRAGQPMEIRDVQIAGIAASRRATVATRNTRHIEGTGVDLWD
ncbi:type II toxin-antitoxin system VapC family toxin [Mycobacterium servetii]|uniref:Type II toxin-antitoxin system VapC family toxin n=1 Tax=Mycobacterium servetii TaxID=3237418 RepID=A0ABV4CE70_9MYCO